MIPLTNNIFGLLQRILITVLILFSKTQPASTFTVSKTIRPTVSFSKSYCIGYQYDFHQKIFWKPCETRSNDRYSKNTYENWLPISAVSTSYEEEIPISEEENLKTEIDDNLESYSDTSSFPEGVPKGFYVVKQYQLSKWNCSSPYSNFTNGKVFSVDNILLSLSIDDIDRLNLTTYNITLPVALMIADPVEFPTMSRARKACRKGNIIVHRCMSNDELEKPFTNVNNYYKGKVGDRIDYRTHFIGLQVRLGNGYYPLLTYEKPPFDLPVVYEDDYFALVNKPAGVVVYGTGKERVFRLSVRAALPFALAPPARGTYAILRRPTSVHRLDKPTSGLLVIAKTKPAMVNLARQFHDRIVKKTYMAIVNGIPDVISESKLSSEEAFQLGVDVNRQDDSIDWQLIDSPLDDKNAITIWRSCQYVKSLYANDGRLTLVEVKLKTGRYHQIRRHMASNCKTPIVGDKEYDGGRPDALKLRGRGLFLCSTRITLEHPFYNSPLGRVVWDNLSEESKVFPDGKLWLSDNDRVMIAANIELPDKFQNLLTRAEMRFDKFSEENQMDEEDQMDDED